jgi:HSP20 family molecular chaperone IbpA
MKEQSLEKKEKTAVAAKESAGYVFTPKVDIWETQDAIQIVAEMPGVDDKSVDISLEDRALSIVGRVGPEDIGGYDKVYSEYQVGNYERTFTIPYDIDRDRIKAAVRQGILKLVLPKSESAKPRRIEVKVE